MLLHLLTNCNVFAILAAIILVFHGFTSLFALSTFVNIPFCAEICFLLLIVFYNIRIKLSLYSIFLLCFIGLVIFAFAVQFFSSQQLDTDSLKFIRMHIFIAMHVIVYLEILHRFGLKFFFRLYLIGFLCIVIFGGFDFVLANFAHVYLDNYLPRAKTQFSSGTIGNIFRLRSGFQEAGNFAHYLNVVFPLLMLAFRKTGFKILLPIYTLSLLLTFSVTGYLVASILLSFKLIFFNKNLFNRIVVVLVLTGLFCGINKYLQTTDILFLQLMYKKMMFTDSISSAKDRSGRYNFANSVYKEVYIKSVSTMLGGLGNGYFKNRFATVGNLYLTYLLENGIVVGCVFIGFSLYCFIRSFKLAAKDNKMKYLTLSLLATILHFQLLQTAFELFSWLPFIIFSYIVSGSRKSEEIVQVQENLMSKRHQCLQNI